MAGGYYPNPYTVESPVGAGLQNIALALFRGRDNERRSAALNDMRDRQGNMYDSHADLYREQANKAQVERRLAERLLRDQGPDAQEELIAASAGVPVHTVRGYRDALGGAPIPGFTLQDYNDVAPRISRGMLAVRPAYADKTINPVNIAQALDVLKKTADRDAMIGGTMQPSTAGQAYAAVEGKPLFHFNEGSAGNLFTGAQNLNEVGAGKAREARGRAFEHEQHGRVYQTEAATGVRVGPPLLIDSEAGSVWASPRAAVGQRPGIDPTRVAVARAGSRGGAGDSTVTTTIAPLKIGKQDADLLLGGIDRAVGGKLGDKILEGAILARAQEYYSTPGSPAFGKHEEAARRAARDVAPSGFESPWFGGMKPIGDTQTSLAPIQTTGPTTRDRVTSRNAAVPPGAKPPAAPQAGAPTTAARPKGKTDKQLIDEANAAIQKGADKGKAMERLKAWGVEVN